MYVCAQTQKRRPVFVFTTMKKTQDVGDGGAQKRGGRGGG